MGKTVQTISLSMKTNSTDQTEQIRLPRGIERNPKRPRSIQLLKLKPIETNSNSRALQKKIELKSTQLQVWEKKTKVFWQYFFCLHL